MSQVRYRKFLEATYGANIHVVVCRDPGAIEKFFDRKFQVELRVEDELGMCVNMDDLGIAIVLTDWKKNPQGCAALVHECFHAAEYILKRRDIRHSRQTSEVFAYLIDSLFLRCLNVLK